MGRAVKCCGMRSGAFRARGRSDTENIADMQAEALCLKMESAAFIPAAHGKPQREMEGETGSV